MKQYRKTETLVQAFVADFELLDGDDTFEVSVAWSDWDGITVEAHAGTGETLDADDVARRFGFRDDRDMALTLIEDTPLTNDDGTLRPLNAGEVTR
jgi:hypothetical protein